jgi:hypothetical protein
MKKLFTVIVMLMLGVGAFAQTNTQPTPKKESAVKFNEYNFNFGEVAYGSDVSHVFTFKNISNTPVAVKNVATSCGCTTPSYSKEPVMPKKSGQITAKYDSTRPGPFTKTLTVSLNDEEIILTISGTIKQMQNEQPKGETK